MSTTPKSELSPSLPTPSSSGSRSKTKLPMIVDISIDDSGKQVYQIHETSKLVRKEMPISNFVSNTVLDENMIGDTPTRTVPLSLPLSPSRKRSLSLDSVEGSNDERYSPQSANRDDGEVWGPEVEDAFEEALRIIPKNGLTKIKVSGRSCGRNELISDFILQKTGKLRTRKQVSSHIQVHKNMGKNPELIDLINNGPNDEDAAKNFDKIFSRITFQKSIGETVSNSNTMAMTANPNIIKKRKLSGVPGHPSIENFSMSFNNDGVDYEFTKLEEPTRRTLRVNDNAKIDNRFPYLLRDLGGITSSLSAPIIHNLCKISLPDILLNQGKFESNLTIKLDDEEDYSAYSLSTNVYSFGNEVLKLNEDLSLFEVSHNKVSNERLFNYSFLNKFWLFFLKNLNENTNEYDKNFAFKGITIKQIIHRNDVASTVKAVLLWEFINIGTSMATENYTVSNYLKLPEFKITADTNIHPQPIYYQPGVNYNYPHLTHSATTASSNYSLPMTGTTATSLDTIPQFVATPQIPCMQDPQTIGGVSPFMEQSVYPVTNPVINENDFLPGMW